MIFNELSELSKRMKSLLQKLALRFTKKMSFNERSELREDYCVHVGYVCTYIFSLRVRRIVQERS